MSEDAALALLRLLAQEGEVSQPRAARRLGLGASELQRLLVALGDDPRFDGLDLVTTRTEPHRTGARTLLRLTPRGQALWAEAGAPAGESRGDAA
jgi:DNA-binding MarR family transcriptional regulator